MRTRFRACLLVLAATLFHLPQAYAFDGQLFLNWDDCALGSGSRDAVGICQTNDGANALVSSFTVGQTVDNVIGIEITVDFQSGQGALSDWWQMQEGHCRDGQLRVSGDFSNESACADPWRNLGSGVAIFYYPGFPHSRDDQARMVGTYAIRSDSARVIAAGTVYYALKLLIGNQHTVVPDQCAGCQQAACLVLNSIKLLRGPKSVPTEILLETPGPLAANIAVWSHGTGADCAAVPVRASSWGRIKQLYR